MHHTKSTHTLNIITSLTSHNKTIIIGDTKGTIQTYPNDFTFVSHKPTYDYLESADISERITCISKIELGDGRMNFIVGNERVLKMWSINEKREYCAKMFEVRNVDNEHYSDTKCFKKIGSDACIDNGSFVEDGKYIGNKCLKTENKEKFSSEKRNYDERKFGQDISILVDADNSQIKRNESSEINDAVSICNVTSCNVEQETEANTIKLMHNYIKPHLILTNLEKNIKEEVDIIRNKIYNSCENNYVIEDSSTDKTSNSIEQQETSPRNSKIHFKDSILNLSTQNKFISINSSSPTRHRLRHNYGEIHLYNLHTIATIPKTHLFFTVDYLQILLHDLSRPSHTFLNIKPDSIEDLKYLITSLSMHSSQIFTYTTSNGDIITKDLRVDPKGKVISNTCINSFITNTFVDENYLYVRENNGLQLFDIRNIQNPVKKYRFDDCYFSEKCSTEKIDLKVKDGFVVTGGYNGKFYHIRDGNLGSVAVDSGVVRNVEILEDEVVCGQGRNLRYYKRT